MDEFIKRFKYKDDLLSFGEDGLCEAFKNVIDDIDSDHIVRFGGMDSEFAELIGFSNYDEVKKLNNKSVSILDRLICDLSKNIISQAKIKNTLINRMLYSNWYKIHKDLEIRFIKEKDRNGNHILSFVLMSYSSNGCGSGDSFRIYIVNKTNLENELKAVKESKLGYNTKKFLVKYFNECNPDDINLNEILNETKESLLEDIKYFIKDYKEEFTSCLSLKEQKFSYRLEDRLNEWVKNFHEEIYIEYDKDNKNILRVFFSGELIKEIKKISYTEYDII